jgi:hypothetical protein
MTYKILSTTLKVWYFCPRERKWLLRDCNIMIPKIPDENIFPDLSQSCHEVVTKLSDERVKTPATIKRICYKVVTKLLRTSTKRSKKPTKEFVKPKHPTKFEPCKTNKI